MNFYTESDKKKGKKNKLKIGQKVKALPNLVDWHARRLSWSYGKKVSDDQSYNEGEKEISLENLRDVYFWTFSYLSGKMPKGVIDHYGSEGNDDGIDRKSVWVVFTLKTKFGKIVHETFVDEKNLEAVKT